MVAASDCKQRGNEYLKAAKELEPGPDGAGANFATLAILWYTVGISKCSDTDGHLKKVLFSNRAQAHLDAGDFHLAKEDALVVLRGGFDSKASFRLASALLHLREVGEVRRVCAAAQAQHALPTASSAAFQELIHKSEDIADVARPLDPELGFGGPSHGMSVEDWLSERSSMREGWAERVRQIMKMGAHGCVQYQLRNIHLGGNPETAERFIENERASARIARVDGNIWKAVQRSNQVASVAEDLRQFLEASHNVKFDPNVFVHSAGSNWSSSQAEWWADALQVQASRSDPWQVNVLTCWEKLPVTWRCECMKKSLVKICRDIDGFNHYIMFCPEVAPNKLAEMSRGPAEFIKLCRKCCGPSDEPLRQLPEARLGYGLAFLEADKDTVCFEHIKGCCYNLHDEDMAAFMVDWHTCDRWSFLTCFCYYTLLELICKEEPVVAMLNRHDREIIAQTTRHKFRQKATELGMPISGAMSRAAFQTVQRQQQIASDCPSSVYRPCESCSSAGARKKCEACWEHCKRHVAYCSAACQKSDWKKHRNICGKVIISNTVVDDEVRADSAGNNVNSNPSTADVVAALQRVDTTGRSKNDCFRLVKEEHPEWILSGRRFGNIFKGVPRSQESTLTHSTPTV